MFMKDELKINLDSLNDAQGKPTLHKDVPLIVIAGAGSGKTRVLTYRIVMSQGVDSFSILTLTFTNKAAREMKSRIGELLVKVKQEISGWALFIQFLPVVKI